MILLIAMFTVGILFLAGAPRLSGGSEIRSENEVRAYIDGKPVDSYLKER